MDVWKIKPPGAVVLRKSTEEGLRPPLTPSEKNNAIPVSRKPRAEEDTSRCNSGVATVSTPPHSTIAATKGCSSPNVGRMVLSPTPSFAKRLQSGERRQPTMPLSRASAPSSPSRPQALSSPSWKPLTPVQDVAVEMQLSSRRCSGNRAPDGLWPSMRNLCASFLSDSASISFSKREKPVINSTVISENKSKPSANATLEGKRSPPRGKNSSDLSENSKSVADQQRWSGMVNSKFSARTRTRSMDLTGRVSGVRNSPCSQRGVSPVSRAHISDGPTRGLGKTVNEASRKMPLEENVMGRTQSWSHPSRTLSLPPAESPCPSSPSLTSLASGSSSRSMVSPCTRPLAPTSSRTSTGRIGISSSVLSYFVNLRKGKKSASRIEDAHQLRLLDNRYLQWRFVNARADAAMFIKKTKAEKILHSVWETTSGLLDYIILNRINMQQLRQEMKLGFILRDQNFKLHRWHIWKSGHCWKRSNVVPFQGPLSLLKQARSGCQLLEGQGQMPMF